MDHFIVLSVRPALASLRKTEAFNRNKKAIASNKIKSNLLAIRPFLKAGKVTSRATAPAQVLPLLHWRLLQALIQAVILTAKPISPLLKAHLHFWKKIIW